VLLAAALGACGGDGGEGAGPAADEGDAATEEVEVVEEPEQDPTDVDDPTQFAFGQEVKVVDGGVEPKLLAADKDAPILIRNTTEAPVEVRFTNPGWDFAGTTTTGQLAPGATFELEPIGVASITYELVGTSGVRGIIQVEEGLDGI
jgi:hypothetical protein